jgi:hypothetical protein
MVCVAAEEKDAYLAAVPRERLMTHNVKGLPAIRNWLNKTVQEDCLVMIDDDMRGLFATMRKKRRLVTDPTVIRQVIENSHRVCEDLGLGVFCWCRHLNPIVTKPELLPVRLVGPISCAFGVRGAARERNFVNTPREDLEFTMQTLLDDRILYCDMRWYFDHGRIFCGRGGNVGLIDDAWLKQAEAESERRWGRYFSRKKHGWVRAASSDSMSIVVRRQNPACVSLRN